MSLRVDEQNCKLPHDFEARCSMEILPDLEWKYGLHPSVKGQKLTNYPGHRKVNYKAGTLNYKFRLSSGLCLQELQMLILWKVSHMAVFSMEP